MKNKNKMKILSTIIIFIIFVIIAGSIFYIVSAGIADKNSNVEFIEKVF